MRALRHMIKKKDIETSKFTKENNINQSESSKNQVIANNQTGDKNSDSTEKTNNTVLESSNNTDEDYTKSISVSGKYRVKESMPTYYHESNLVISNQDDTSINFAISAVHGKSEDSVNIGEVSGTATKIEVPQDSVIPNSTQYAYQFIENRDGNTYKITLVYTAHKMFQYVLVSEDYSNGINPYAGHNVYFEGEYEKIG